VAELTVARDPENKRAFLLETVGRVVLVPKKWWGAIRIEVDGLPSWTMTIGRPRLHPVYEAIEDGRGTVATFAQDDGRLSCGGRELTITPRTGKSLKGSPWALREADREIAIFPVHEWGLWKVTITVVDDEAFRRNPRLMLFAAWCAQRISASSVGVAP
jgi:hypothetical protein